jgi:RNA polymerase sigma-70 factor (ECF subfamily)
MAEVPPDTASPDAVAPDLECLVQTLHADLYRYAYRLTGSVADAEDLTQQAFLLAQEKLHQLRDPAAARAWLFAILRNAYLKSTRRRVPISAASIDLNVDEIPGEEGLIEAIDTARLQAALNELADPFKLVLLLFYFEECSYREIAQRLELPIGTVMSRLARAKSQLRARLLEAEHTAGGRTHGRTPPG